jgi:hypothetical protein
VLYELVTEHLEAFLRYARDEYSAPLPKYVEDEFRSLLSCGDFSRGFIVVRCQACDDHLAVAFSCKRRTACPSCAGRRMAAEAALLVDRVLPCVPVRQYVLAFPYDLSGLAATRPEVLTYLSRVFWEALRHRYRAWAKSAGLGNASRVETGAVTGVPRAGSSLNLHVHFHTLCADGVYVEDESGTLRFVEAPPPSRAELEAMVARIFARVMKWLKRRGLLRDEEDSHAESPLLPMDALAQAALSRGSLVTVRDALDDDDNEEPARPQPSTRTKTDAVVFERFNLHAGIRIAASDDIGRERSCRYLARPPFALGRIRKRRDGLVGYRVKKVSRHKTTERVMSPVEFLARLASILAPPRFPLLRLHGVFGARHAWRARVVPKPPVTGSPKKARDDAGAPAHANNAAHDRSAAPASPSRARGAPAPAPSTGGTNTQAGDGSTAFAQAAPPLSTASLVGAGAECVGPNVLSLTHWDRLDSGDLYAAIDGQSLLRRTFDVDLRVCARCGGRTFVRAVVTEPHHIERILDVLRRQRDPPAAA